MSVAILAQAILLRSSVHSLRATMSIAEAVEDSAVVPRCFPRAMATAAAVEAAFAGAARGGATRQTLAAMIAALLRTEDAIVCNTSGAGADQAETEARLEAVRPVISAQVASAAEGKACKLGSRARAARNIAVHNFEVEFGTLNPASYGRVQRGGQGRSAQKHKEAKDGQVRFDGMGDVVTSLTAKIDQMTADSNLVKDEVVTMRSELSLC